MIYQFLADLVIIIHFAFVVFVVFGAFLVLKWQRLAWLHVPAFLWGAIIELAGWICPLTHLEYWLASRTGHVVQDIGFIDRYLVPIIYPTSLTRQHQIISGIIVIGINAVLYAWVFWRCFKCRTRPQSD